MMDLKTLVTYIFMIIGILVCIVVTAVALVWVTCFVIRVLIRTFGTKVRSYSEVVAEDIREKSAIKKEFKAQERAAYKEQKAELVSVKIESKERMNQLKKKKLEQKYREKEKQKSLKLFGTYEEPDDSVFGDQKNNAQTELNTKIDIDKEIDKEEDYNISEIETNDELDSREDINETAPVAAEPIHDDEADYFDYTSEITKSSSNEEETIDENEEDLPNDDEKPKRLNLNFNYNVNDDDENDQLDSQSQTETTISDSQTQSASSDDADDDFDDFGDDDARDEREREIAKKLSQIRDQGEDVEEFIIVEDEPETENFDEKFASLTSIKVDETQEESNEKAKKSNSGEDDFDFHKYLQASLNKEIEDDEDGEDDSDDK